MNNIICSKCGSLIDNDSKFCSQCGAIIELNNYNRNNGFNYNMLSKEELDLNWPTIIYAIIGVILGIVAIFVFWWLTIVGLSIEMKTLRDIKTKKQRGKIIAYMGISICGAGIIWYALVRLLL